MKTRLAVARSLGRKTATVIIYFGMRHLGFDGTSAGKDVHMAEHDGQLSTLLYQALFHSRVWYLCDRAAKAVDYICDTSCSLTNQSVAAQYALLVSILLVRSTMQGQSDSVVPMFTESSLIRIFYAIVAGSPMLV